MNMQGTIHFGAEAEVAFCSAFKRIASGVACPSLSYKYGVCLPARTPSRDAFKAVASPVDRRPVDYLHYAGVVTRPPHKASHLSHAAKTNDVTPNMASPLRDEKRQGHNHKNQQKQNDQKTL